MPGSHSFRNDATDPSSPAHITDYLDRSGVVSSASKVLQLFPHKMANVDYASRGIVLYSVFGKIMPPIAIQRVLYPCLTVAMGLLAYELFRRKQIR